MKLMYTCREIADLVSEQLDVKLPVSVKMRMAMHISMCPDCKNYRDQIRHIENFLKSYFAQEYIDNSITLSDEDLHIIEQKILQKSR